jgi:hypothetical protein
MIKQVRIRTRGKKGERFIIGIKLLREPTEDDLKTHKTRRLALAAGKADGTLLEDLESDDVDMHDLMDEEESDDGNTNEEIARIPPQWTPDRLLSNTIFDVLALAGTDGGDSELLRQRTMGQFWKRPLESYVSRLTDDWERSQPHHLRHLAILRNNVITKDKRALHYVYRTYENYKKAIEVREVIGSQYKLDPPHGVFLDEWGFRPLALDDFLGRTGSKTIAECRPTVLSSQSQYWDKEMTLKMGYKNPIPSINLSETLIAQLQEEKAKQKQAKATGTRRGRPLGVKNRPKDEGPLATVRTDANESSTSFHHPVANRPQTSTADGSETSPLLVRHNKGKPKGPLLSAEERVKLGFPPRGRLGKNIENHIRRERGLEIKASRPRKSRNYSKQERLLTMEQRVKMGLPRIGRLKDSIIEEFRRKRDMGLPYDAPFPVGDDNPGKELEAVQDMNNVVNDTDRANRPESTVASLPIASIEHDASTIAKASSLKRSAERIGAKSSRTTKRARLESSVPGGEVPQPEVVAASSETAVLPAKRKLDHFLGNTARTPKQARTGSHLSSSIPPRKSRRLTGVSTPAPATPSSLVSGEETSVAGNKTAASVMDANIHIPDALSDRPLSKAEMRMEEIKANYANRDEPGLYYNPFALRKPGRGRPRRVLLATFRLLRLHELSWFGPTLATVDRPLPPHPPAAHAATEAVNLQELDLEMTDEVNAEAELHAGLPVRNLPDVDHPETLELPMAFLETTRESLGSPVPSGITVDPSVPNDRILTSPRTIPDTVESPSTEDLPVPMTKPQQGSNTTPGDVQESPVAIGLDPSRYPSEPRLPPAGWNAINIPNTDKPRSYQSPYGTPSPAQPSLVAPVREEIVSSAASAEPPALLTNPPINGLPHTTTKLINSRALYRSRRKSQKAAVAGAIRLGKGSVQYARISIIRHILDLCNGAFPANGEIVVVFEAVWKERAPKKMSCPDRSTILKTFADMIRDPTQKLRKVTMQFASIEVEAPAKKHYILSNNLANDSPEAIRVKNGILQAYPYRYFPLEVAHYVNPEPKPNVMDSLEVDDTIQVDNILPSRARELKLRIRETARLRRQAVKEAKEKKQQEAEERKECSIAAEMGQTVQPGPVKGAARGKRVRLVGLKQTGQLKRRLEDAPPPRLLHEREFIPSTTASRDEVTISSGADSSSHEDDDDGNDEEGEELLQDTSTGTLMTPATFFYPSSGTFSTEYHILQESCDGAFVVPARALSVSMNTSSLRENGSKRIRIDNPVVKRLHKEAYPTSRDTDSRTDDPCVDTNGSQEENDDSIRRKRATQKPARLPDPTLVERLTGLTGDPSDPDYQPPTRKQKTFITWEERKTRLRNRRKTFLKYPESLDPIDKFKKLCCAFVVASSMSGEESTVDWDIMKTVYHEDPYFDLEKTKNTWSWMRKHMEDQLRKLTTSFQTSFLEAYEQGTLASIEDPESYDWANLVRWALHHCAYPEPLLPAAREALNDFEIDVSSFDVLDRSLWYDNKYFAFTRRTQRLLKYAYAAPLHQAQETPRKDPALKARSWIRANISTPKKLYDKKKAHDKLRPLGEPVLGQVVSDLVEAKIMRMWRLKRLRPGRNYDFTGSFAKKYRRLFELEHFMAATKCKKNLDIAFAQEDPEKRSFVLSRTANDGTVMAVLSLVSAGQVKLVPRLPPINSDFDAPLPRLSVWGLCEGTYATRLIDRERLFWEVDVVPTSTYQYGNPLQPIASPPLQGKDGSLARWPTLLEPPLPGRDSPDALLPIWSSIDGKSVTWPWWNRILNLVLQVLLFQPGLTATQILGQCPKYTTEMFEIELVLDWLEAVKAVHRSDHGTYDVLPGFWAVFGDTLLGEEDDEFGEHVKKNGTNKVLAERDRRSEYNLRQSTIQQTMGFRIEGSASEDEDDEEVARPAKRQKVVAPKPRVQLPPTSLEPPIDPTLLSISPIPSIQDVDMMDTDRDAEGVDVDAEGELDESIVMDANIGVDNW